MNKNKWNNRSCKLWRRIVSQWVDGKLERRRSKTTSIPFYTIFTIFTKREIWKSEFGISSERLWNGRLSGDQMENSVRIPRWRFEWLGHESWMDFNYFNGTMWNVKMDAHVGQCRHMGHAADLHGDARVYNAITNLCSTDT